MLSDSGQIICVGGILWETSFHVDEIPGRGVKLLPRDAQQIASGMAVSAAASIAKLGGAAELWGLLGDDSNGQACLRNLSDDGIAVAQLEIVPGGRTPFSTVLIDPAGERLVVPYFDPALFAAPVRLPLARIAQARAVLADVRWVEGAEAALRHAQECGVPAILDADLAPRAVLECLMKLADHVLFSEVALLSLFDGLRPHAALLAMAEQLPQAEVIGVTLGAEGSLLWERARPGDIHHTPSPNIRAVDTLNAGDVWHGAYAYGLSVGMSATDRVRFANVAAAIKCERPGGRLGAPTLPDVLARLR